MDFYMGLFILFTLAVVFILFPVRPFVPEVRRRAPEGGTPVSETDGGKLYATIAGGECPRCHESSGFYAGPEGGISQNIYCMNRNCRAFYNITPMVGTADDMGHAPDWFKYPGDPEKPSNA